MVERLFSFILVPIMIKTFFKAVLLFFLFVNAASVQAQDINESPDTTKKVLVDFANIFEYIVEGADTYQRLLGEVEMRQDSIYLYCDSAFIKNETQVTAQGNVLIQQGDTLNVFADSANYNGLTRQAKLFENVVLLNKNQKLFTDSLLYDMNTKIATYVSGATFTNDTTQLTSQKGYYYTAFDVAYFKEDVLVVNPEFSLKADTLRFNTKTRVVHFLGPTLISTKDNGKIYCEGGFYDIKNKKAEFYQNAQYVKDAQQAEADVIVYDGATGIYTLEGNAKFKDENRNATADLIKYDEKNDQTFLIGNARYKDDQQNVVADEIFYDAKNKSYRTSGRSEVKDGAQTITADKLDFDDLTGLGIAEGNVVWIDTVQNFVLYADAADYDKESNYVKTKGGRPLFVSIVEGDSLFMKADTLISKMKEPDTLTMDSIVVDTISADSFSIDTIKIQTGIDTGRIVLAYNNVRIFKSDLQAISDSMVYDVSDSLFYFYDDPIIWSDTSQFSADSIWMSMKDNELHRIFLKQKAFILNSPDQILFNQIKGKEITAFFKDQELRKMHVEGNAESVYYAIDEKDGYIGVNKSVCSEMNIYFGNNQVDRIKFFTQPQAKLTPMSQVVDSKFKLEGYNWVEPPKRPLTKNDL